eukprot:TRINITY_DN12070_c0_g1_i5.p1 TRINITY_DN12070_c0_g1~~TRINITY_DN12070_c0_g1_i5.p1  ORF type:complete len:744 (+),score=245.95 TRINITY_DN12070_c0_g1_i5:110-2233(+)
MLMCALLAQVASARVGPESPVNKVLVFIEELKDEITDDMQKENASFTKFDAWCSETIETANKNIKSGEEVFEACNREIEKLSGFKAAGGAEIKHAEESLAENVKRQADITKVRETEAKDYKANKDELEAAIKAMEDALSEFASSDVTAHEVNLDSTTSQAPSFMQRMKVSKNIRKLLQTKIVHDKLSIKDQSILEAVAGGRRSSQGFLQLERGDINGEYNSASGQVVQVIETTKKDFEKDLEELNADEAEKIKVFQALLKTLEKEETDTRDFLTEQKELKGTSAATLAQQKTLRDQTEVQLKADKKLLTATTDTCKEKTYQFGQRLKLREQELRGVDQALEILSSDNATATFSGAANVSFIQLQKSQANSQAVNRKRAYKLLKKAASKTHDLEIGKIAVLLQKTTGYFDKVIDKIDVRIKYLREEEADDVKHRDRCQTQLADSSKEIATLSSTISKTDTKLSRMSQSKSELQATLATIQEDIKDTKKDMADLEEERNEEHEVHVVALKHDKDALALMEKAIVQISNFFKKNKIDVGQEASLVQRVPNKTERGKYELMPDAGFEDADYEGAKDATKGLLGMMDLVKDDMAKEIEDDIAHEAKDEALFAKDYAALKELLDSQEAKEISTDKALALLLENIEAKSDYRESKQEKKQAEEANKVSLENDCDWVKTRFDTRKTARRQKIQDLIDAKAFLAGTQASSVTAASL